MPNLDILFTWFHLFEWGQEIIEYDDLKIQFNSLIAKVERNRNITVDDDNEFYIIIKTQRRRIISEMVNVLDNKTKYRKFTTSNFSDEIKIIDECRRRGEDDLDIEIYDQIISKLEDIDETVDRKSSTSIRTLFIGIFIGIFCSVIGGYILLKIV